MSGREYAVSAAVLALCTLTGFFFGAAAGAAAFAAAAVMLLLQVFFGYRERRRLSDLIAKTDRLLREPETPFLSDYSEGELAVLGNNIQKLSRTLREQNEALRSDHAALKEALENLSHQLRTPLTSMTLLLDLLRNPSLTPAQHRKYTQELSNLLGRMQWLIELLLKLSAIDANAVQFQSEPVSCRRMIAAACGTVAVSAELKAITMETEIAGEPQYTGDYQRSCEAMINILKNCIEHTPEGGSVRITASQSPVMAEITVTDSGSGFSQTDLPHLFERFYRSADAAPGSGYGIGLAYAQKVFAMQNGVLEATNAEPHGAFFRIRLYPGAV